MKYLSPLPAIKLPYTIRVDKEFHENPQATIYDIQVLVDDPLRAAITSYISNPVYPQNLLKINALNDSVALVVQKISNSRSKQAFFDEMSRNPTGFIAKWLSSQQRDLEIMSGQASRGGGEDAQSEEFRRGGKDSIWGGEDVRETVNLLVGVKNRPAGQY